MCKITNSTLLHRSAIASTGQLMINYTAEGELSRSRNPFYFHEQMLITWKRYNIWLQWKTYSKSCSLSNDTVTSDLQCPFSYFNLSKSKTLENTAHSGKLHFPANSKSYVPYNCTCHNQAKDRFNVVGSHVQWKSGDMLDIEQERERNLTWWLSTSNRKWYLAYQVVLFPPTFMVISLACCKPFKMQFLTQMCSTYHCSWRAICLR